MASQTRPKNLDLLRFRLPAVGYASIAHRISGVLMFLAIPLFLYLLELSLSHPEGFAQVAALMSSVVFKLIVVALVWALVHHLCAGIRYLLLDIDVGIEKAAARQSAIGVIVIGGVAALITLVGVFL
ncbi:MAG: succinate dehydrogenase, cytochrome b556 subunit [Proteobacteria bacterium]|nr:MAG: succinate dehydrogenase, cytochrome b556 subunit [Pseudomonadota bacterium]QKK12245.1 MAG: succinate dehydrogenase, cytochrome b556 subunit [Pseudomonadota bacterium]